MLESATRFIYSLIRIGIYVILISALFLAFNGIFSVINSLVFGSVLGDIISLISLCLPFNLGVFVGSLGIFISVWCAFAIARKVYNISTSALSGSSD